MGFLPKPASAALCPFGSIFLPPIFFLYFIPIAQHFVLPPEFPLQIENSTKLH
jgi:hypothetical protein